MSELSKILEAVDRSDDQSWALATVVGVSGSTYRLPGAKQLLRADGTSVGTVSGGCLDADLVRIVGEVIGAQIPRFVTYDLAADDDEIWGFGLGCNGVTELLVEPGSTAGPLLRELAAADEASEAIAIVTVLDEPLLGSRLVVRADGLASGELGPGELRDAAEDAATRAIERGDHTRTTLPPDVSVFIEVRVPAPQLLVCGAGNDALPLVRYGSELGWRITVIDDRRAYLTSRRFPEAKRLIEGRALEVDDLVSVDRRTAAVVMTHNYARDTEYLGRLLETPARYIGMLGPRARTNRILADLRRDGADIPHESLDRVYAPAGLDIGAEGPDQIAWAILTEIMAVTRRRTGAHLRDRKGGIHRPATEEKAT